MSPRVLETINEGSCPDLQELELSSCEVLDREHCRLLGEALGSGVCVRLEYRGLWCDNYSRPKPNMDPAPQPVEGLHTFTNTNPLNARFWYDHYERSIRTTLLIGQSCRGRSNSFDRLQKRSLAQSPSPPPGARRFKTPPYLCARSDDSTAYKQHAGKPCKEKVCHQLQ